MEIQKINYPSGCQPVDEVPDNTSKQETLDETGHRKFSEELIAFPNEPTQSNDCKKNQKNLFPRKHSPRRTDIFDVRQIKESRDDRNGTERLKIGFRQILCSLVDQCDQKGKT